MQTSKNDVSFKFKTTAAAVRLSICSSNGGRAADVMVDGKKCGTADTYSVYSAMDYPTQWTELPNDGKEHTVEYVVQDTSADKTVFSVCGVMERFN